MTSKENRRLAAIFVLDVYGFSRQMAKDESGTLARVLDQRRAVIEPLIAAHDGRIVKLMGDGVLAEFPSVTFAVQCADEIQQRTARSAEEAEPLLLRIGINLGEVIVEDGDIYGDGVNVAARLESLAPPGGIAISGAVHDQVHKRLKLAFHDMGLHEVKNIPEPVRVWEVLPEKGTAGGDLRMRSRRRRSAVVFLMVVAVAALLIAGYWWMTGVVSSSGLASADPLDSFDPDRPSVVVLPFDNLSGNPDQDYFSDGITDNLITDLSRLHDLMVIARSTSFSYRDRTVELADVARDLRVRYVVTGSVQRDGDRVRINAAVTDAGTGFQLWADRFDRQASDLFALQDEVTGRVVEALEVELTEQQRQMLAMRETDSVEAYDAFLRARGLLSVESSATRGTQAQPETGDMPAAVVDTLDRALELDPDFSAARALRASQAPGLFGGKLSTERDRIVRAGAQAAMLDEMPASALGVLAVAHAFEGRHGDAVALARRAVRDDPNYADGYAVLGWVLALAGQVEDAERALAIARRLNPLVPAFYSAVEAEIRFAMGDDAGAAGLAAEALSRNSAIQRTRALRAAALANLGRFDEASREMERLLKSEPGLTTETLADVAPFAREEVRDRLVAGLRLAGLAE